MDITADPIDELGLDDREFARRHGCRRVEAAVNRAVAASIIRTQAASRRARTDR